MTEEDKPAIMTFKGRSQETIGKRSKDCHRRQDLSFKKEWYQ
jgi:hypothetical protein